MTPEAQLIADAYAINFIIVPALLLTVLACYIAAEGYHAWKRRRWERRYYPQNFKR